MKFKLKTDIQGNSPDDLVTALREMARLINNGFTGGFNANGEGRFSFEILDGISRQPNNSNLRHTASAGVL